MDLTIQNVLLAGKAEGSRWDISCSKGVISKISATQQKHTDFAPLLTKSLCHPHIHLDKCFLLSHPKFKDLKIQKGDFAEALELTNQAKARFAHDDLVERGSALILESIRSGVTHMRAFVEVDPTVQLKCLAAGLTLKRMFHDRCHVQLCVFAQDPIFSYDDGGAKMQALLNEAVRTEGVDAFGSTPYVEEEEGNDEKQVQNIKFAIELARKNKLHLDFHIDYNLDPSKQVLVLKAIDMLHSKGWSSDQKAPDFKTVVFGHCTRLTLLEDRDWRDLLRRIGPLPVHFIGLPTSDIYMMGKPQQSAAGTDKSRGTLQVLQMIKIYRLNAAIGINNVGNAFTPQGNCDPLTIASLGVGLYQAGTEEDTSILFDCVSTRAKSAIGLQCEIGPALHLDTPANFVVFSHDLHSSTPPFRTDKSIEQLIYSGGLSRRTTYYNGRIVT